MQWLSWLWSGAAIWRHKRDNSPCSESLCRKRKDRLLRLTTSKHLNTFTSLYSTNDLTPHPQNQREDRLMNAPRPQRPSGIALSWIGEGFWKPEADSPSSTAWDSSKEPKSMPSDSTTSSVRFRVSMSWAAFLTEAAMLTVYCRRWSRATPSALYSCSCGLWRPLLFGRGTTRLLSPFRLLLFLFILLTTGMCGFIIMPN